MNYDPLTFVRGFLLHAFNMQRSTNCFFTVDTLTPEYLPFVMLSGNFVIIVSNPMFFSSIFTPIIHHL